MRTAAPWEDSPNETGEYLLAVDEILSLMEGLSVGSDHEVSDRAENAIQIAMSRLEDEFRHILIRNTVPLDFDRLYGSIRRVSLSFASQDGDFAEEFESFGEIDGRFHERGGSLGDDVCVDLINPDAVVELKEIAYRMIRSGYEKECVQVYSSVRRDALDEWAPWWTTEGKGFGAVKAEMEEKRRRRRESSVAEMSVSSHFFFSSPIIEFELGIQIGACNSESMELGMWVLVGLGFLVMGHSGISVPDEQKSELDQWV